MTLPATGTISYNDIRRELSINTSTSISADSWAPLQLTLPQAGNPYFNIGMNKFYGKSWHRISYYYQDPTTGPNYYIFDSAIDPNSNCVYMVGKDIDSTPNKGVLICARADTGAVVYVRSLAKTNAAEHTTFNSISLAPDYQLGSGYISGTHTGTDGYQNDMIMVKFFLPTGELQWQRRWSDIGQDTGMGVAVNPNNQGGAIYFVGSQNGRAFITKINSSNNQQWQRTFQAASDGAVFPYTPSILTGWNAVCVGQDGRAYCAGFVGNTKNPLLACYDSDGNLAWIKQLTITGGLATAYWSSISQNVWGDIVVAGLINADIVGSIIAAYNTFGELLDHTTISQSGASEAKVHAAKDYQAGVFDLYVTSNNGTDRIRVSKFGFGSNFYYWGTREIYPSGLAGATGSTAGCAVVSSGTVLVSGSIQYNSSGKRAAFLVSTGTDNRDGTKSTSTVVGSITVNVVSTASVTIGYQNNLNIMIPVGTTATSVFSNADWTATWSTVSVVTQTIAY